MKGQERQPGFSWDPECYSKSSSFQQQMAEELIAKLGLQGSERVLDIGCGDGKITAGIARRLPQGSVVGIDSSADMIRYAGRTFPQQEYPRLSFARIDARALPFHREFDLVFSNAALHWIQDPAPVLDGMYRALIPGGRLPVQMGGQGNAGQVLAVLDGMLQSPRWKDYFYGFTFRYGFFSDNQYRQALENAGFEPARVLLIPKEMVHRSREEMAGWIRSTWLPWLEQVPQDGRDAFVQEIIDRYTMDRPADAEGAIRIRMVRLEAEAIKPAD